MHCYTLNEQLHDEIRHKGGVERKNHTGKLRGSVAEESNASPETGVG